MSLPANLAASSRVLLGPVRTDLGIYSLGIAEDTPSAGHAENCPL